jgi:2,3-bisphosphoglycerate-independent phosphoglycerate mutase
MKTEELQFEDAQLLGKLYPDTFEAPTLKQLEDVKPEDFVKVCVKLPNQTPDGERFWVKVRVVEEDDVVGEVYNQLIFVELSHSEIISFKKTNIYSIM